MMDSKLPEPNKFKIYYIQANTVNYQDNASRQRLVFVLAGALDRINPVRMRIIETHLRKVSGDTQLIVTDIEAQSIKLKASFSSLEKLQKLFIAGKLLEVLGIPIENVYLSDETKQECDRDNQDNLESSLSLVRDILENGAFGKDLTNADLKSVNLTGADLGGCDLSGANLEKANLEAANLFYVNLKGTIIDSHTKLDRKWLLVWQIVNQQVDKKLIGVDLSCSYLVNAKLNGANLHNTNFSDANLEGINLECANLTNTNLANTNLESALLKKANLSNANLSNTDLSYADLSGSCIKAANLINADLSNANLSSANLQRAKLNGANLIRANFTDANLKGASLIKTYLSGANLIRVDFRGANLSNAHLDAACLISADLRNANLRNAFLDAANFKGANVENTCFGNNPGISQQIKDDLIRRGAIFGNW